MRHGMLAPAPRNAPRRRGNRELAPSNACGPDLQVLLLTVKNRVTVFSTFPRNASFPEGPGNGWIRRAENLCGTSGTPPG